MLFRQVLHPDLGCASYLIADTAAGSAAVVDPKWEIGEYLALAAAQDVRIEHIVETHNHADHLSGRPRLAALTGARCWASPLAGAGYPHSAFADGVEIELGQVRLRAMHAPGHRPEHTAVVVIDRSRADAPCAVLTGDSLFVNDVARPDLAVEKREGASQLFNSVHRLIGLGDGVEVFPGHTGGSLCGSARMSETTSSTIGFERASNPLLQLDDEQRFVEELVEGLPPQPPNFQLVAELNRDGGPADLPAPERCDAAELERRIAAGALVIDGRAPDRYDAGHIHGSVGVALAFNGFGTKVAWLAGPGDAIALVADDEADCLRMAELLHAVGLSATAMLAGGAVAWAASGRPLATVRVLDPDGLAALSAGDDPPQVLDVREDHEWAEQRIPGSVHVPYHDLGRELPPLDPGRPVAVICSTGRRSAMAAGLVQRAGFGAVIHVTPGGVETWAAHGHPVERSAPVSA